MERGRAYILVLTGLAWLLFGTVFLQAPAVSNASMATSTSSTAVSGRTCLDGAAPPMVNASQQIALVKPVFTATPYSQYGSGSGSFYEFYQTYRNVAGNLTSNLQWLQMPVSSGEGYGNGWGLSGALYQFMKSPSAESCGLNLGTNVQVVSDINVSEGALFAPNGARRYGVAVLGFEEYATQSEYQQLKHFVASGGRLVIMGSDALMVRVNFIAATGIETYVIGHGFAFNGVTAWTTKVNPWRASNTDWVGSDLCCFYKYKYKGASLNLSNPLGKDLAAAFGPVAFKEYSSHEESGLTNLTGTSIVGTFINSTDLVAAYSHQYVKGDVVCICVFATDIISSSPSVQYFLVLAVASASLGVSPPHNCCNGTPYLLSGEYVGGAAIAAVLAVTAGYLLFRRRRSQGTVEPRAGTGNTVNVN